MTATSIADPNTYTDAPPHELFTELRRTSPVHWVEMHDEPGYWAILRHADVIHVAKEPVLFSASTGGIVIEDVTAEMLQHLRGMLLSMDPPRHQDYRRDLSESFKVRTIAGLEGRIRTICGEILDRAAEQSDVEFVHDVTSSLPSQVIGELMGIPPDDWPRIHAMAESLASAQDPDKGGSGDSYAGSGDPFVDMAIYAIEHSQRRRLEPPREDLTTVSEADTSGGEQGDGGDTHERRRGPPEDLGGLAVHVVAHEALAARYPHDHNEEGRGDDTVEDGHKDEQLDGVDVQEAQRGAPDRAQGDEAVEDRGFADRAREPPLLPRSPAMPTEPEPASTGMANSPLPMKPSAKIALAK
jgi:hypothetical protein